MRREDSEAPRQLPYDVDIEQALLGAILIDQHHLNRVAPLIRPRHFYDPLHQRMAETALALWGRGNAVTPLTMKASLGDDAGLVEVGGMAYLVSLARAAPAMPNVVDYCRILTDLELRREMIRIGEDIVSAAFRTPSNDEHDGGLELASMASNALITAASRSNSAAPESLYDVGNAALKEQEDRLSGKRVPTVPTGFSKLNIELGGYRGADFIVVPARPGMGKSAFLGSTALRVALAGYPTIVFSFEMKKKQWVERTLCELDYDELQGRKPLVYQRFRNGTATAEDLDRAAAAHNRLYDVPLHIIDDDKLTIEDVNARARAWAIGRGQIGLVIIDYLQIVAPSERTRDRGREQEVSHIARNAKALAKELDWPVMAACQILNKGNREQNEEKRPTAADIRESGAIEMEADLIFSPWRPAYFLEMKRKEAWKADASKEQWRGDWSKQKHTFELLGLKNRHGRRTDFELWCDIGSSTIRDNAPHTPEALKQQEDAMELFS